MFFNTVINKMIITFKLESSVDLTYAIAGFEGDKQCTPLILVFPGEQKIQLNDSCSIKVFLITGCQNLYVLDCIDICDCDYITYSTKIETNFKIEGEDKQCQCLGRCYNCCSRRIPCR